jgi:hypothetical protein
MNQRKHSGFCFLSLLSQSAITQKNQYLWPLLKNYEQAGNPFIPLGAPAAV